MKDISPELKQDLEQIRALLSDRWWRLNNLYYIKDKGGRKALFRPNRFQKQLYEGLWYFSIIPKARQLGITTFFAILYLDAVLFEANQTARIIAHDHAAMREIFHDKVKFAWQNLPEWLKEEIGESVTDSKTELSFGNGSRISVGTSSRGGVVQFLHISEFGKIAAKFPEKAREIVTGSINSVEQGNVVTMESTAEGASGYFYDYVMEAHKKQLAGTELTPLDFKLFFFPWHENPEYRLSERDAKRTVIDDELAEYFRMLEASYGIKLDDQQKAWYAKKRETNRDDMFREYPSYLEEAFKGATEGAYYNREMQRVYEENRITHVPVDTTQPVHTTWDIGVSDDMVAIFFQLIGGQIRIIDVFTNSGDGLVYAVQEVLRRYEHLGDFYVPWDIEKRNIRDGKTDVDTMYEAGVPRGRIKVTPQGTVEYGRGRVRALFSRIIFDEAKAKPVYVALSNYRRAWDAKNAIFKESAAHDEHSHIADALRTFAVAYEDPLTRLTEDEGATSVDTF